jgi:hypothetical protein
MKPCRTDAKVRREADLEGEFCHAVAQLGGIAEKYVTPGKSGACDRLVRLPGGRVVDAEIKKDPNEKPRPIQLERHRRIRALGGTVYVIDSRAAIVGFVLAESINRGTRGVK